MTLVDTIGIRCCFENNSSDINFSVTEKPDIHIINHSINYWTSVLKSFPGSVENICYGLFCK